MTERIDFADGKYTVINENGKLTALRHGEPWGRDLTGDNLIYWMLMDALKLKAERDALAAKLAEIKVWNGSDEGTIFDFREGQWWVEELDAIFVSPNATPDQKRAVAVVHNLLRKVRELEGQEPVAWLNPYGGVLQSLSTGIERSTYTIPLYARRAPSEPVNARLLEALQWAVENPNDDAYWIERARAAIARAESQLAEPQPDADGLWKSAVIDQLVISHILTAEHENNPRKALQDLLAFESDIAVDPRVSEAAAKLVEQARAEEREACAKVCDQFKRGKIDLVNVRVLQRAIRARSES